jgi:hypothetical protein
MLPLCAELFVLMLHTPVLVSFAVYILGARLQARSLCACVCSDRGPTPEVDLNVRLETTDVLDLVMYFRVYQVLRFVHYNSSFSGNTGRWLQYAGEGLPVRCGRWLTGVAAARAMSLQRITPWFTLQTHVYLRPFSCLGIAFATLLLSLAYAQRVCEWCVACCAVGRCPY